MRLVIKQSITAKDLKTGDRTSLTGEVVVAREGDDDHIELVLHPVHSEVQAGEVTVRVPRSWQVALLGEGPARPVPLAPTRRSD